MAASRGIEPPHYYMRPGFQIQFATYAVLAYKMAEEVGLEPTKTFTSLFAFQANSLASRSLFLNIIHPLLQLQRYL